MKRFLICILTLCLVFSGFSAAAVQSPVATLAAAEDYYQPLENVPNPALCREIYNGILRGDTDIRIIEADYPGIDSNDVFDAIQYVLNYYPELFVVDTSVPLSLWYGSGDPVLGAYYTYSPAYDAERNNAAAVQQYRDAIDEIVALIPKNFSDLEKIVFVHDYFAEHYEYDESYTYYDAYSLFVGKTGVCEAYTMAFTAVMRALGIECTMASNEAEFHAWNLVRLNGRFYHVDVTWDDPTPDQTGLANHNHLLLSDEAISKLRDHSQWTPIYPTDIYCTDTRYEAYEWTQSRAPLTYAEGNWYMLVSAKDALQPSGWLYPLSKDLKIAGEPILTFNDIWPTGQDGYYYRGFFSGLYCIGNTLFGNTPNGLWSYRPSDGFTANYSLSVPAGSSIYGSVYEGNGRIRYAIQTDPTSGTQSMQTYQLLLGDTDGNNRIEALDLVNLRQYLLTGTAQGFNYGLLDVNTDGVTSVLDLIRLKKILAG